jgi:Alpha-glutamyl/putrescinyl thymine pyrophosphorylase clade 3
MPTFCRHNRFIERCPICSKTLPGLAPAAPAAAGTGGGGSGGRGSKPSGTGHARSRARASGPRKMRVVHEARDVDDGYRSTLLPGLRSSADAERLAEEIAFASARLLALGAAPPAVYGEIRVRAEDDLEEATWMCFLTAYLSPLDREDSFVFIRQVLADEDAGWRRGSPPDLDGALLGPRSSHDPARGAETLLAYRHWVERSGGTQASAFAGDAAWSDRRRFQRLFERLALPGFARMGRYDLLVTLGRLGLYELRADSLHFSGARGPFGEDLATLAAKRAFAIGDELILERRALALAEAVTVPVEALDLALANWGKGRRASLGFRSDISDSHALERTRAALALPEEDGSQDPAAEMS